MSVRNKTGIYCITKLIRSCTLVDDTETNNTQFSNEQARCSAYDQNQSYPPYLYRYKSLLFLMEMVYVYGSLARMTGSWVLLQESSDLCGRILVQGFITRFIDFWLLLQDSTYLGVELNSICSFRWQQLGCGVRISLISDGAFWSGSSVHGLEGLGAASGFSLS